MRALLNGERFLSFAAFPTKTSFTQTSSNYVKAPQPWYQTRVYSKGKTPSYPEDDVNDVIKKWQHLKNESLIRSEMPGNLFGHQTVAYSKQLGSTPPKNKADPPGFCDPPKKDPPCVLQSKDEESKTKPDEADQKSKKERKRVIDAKPIPIIPAFPRGKFPCLEKSKKDKNDSKSKTDKKDKKDADKKAKSSKQDRAKSSKKDKEKSPKKDEAKPLMNDKEKSPKKDEAKSSKKDNKSFPKKDEAKPLKKDKEMSPKKDQAKSSKKDKPQSDEMDTDDLNALCSDFSKKPKKLDPKSAKKDKGSDSKAKSSKKDEKQVDKKDKDLKVRFLAICKKSKKCKSRSGQRTNKFEHIIHNHYRKVKELAKKYEEEMKKNKNDSFSHCVRKLKKALAEKTPSDKSIADTKQDHNSNDRKRKRSKERKSRTRKNEHEVVDENKESSIRRLKKKKEADCIQKLEKYQDKSDSRKSKSREMKTKEMNKSKEKKLSKSPSQKGSPLKESKLSTKKVHEKSKTKKIDSRKLRKERESKEPESKDKDSKSISASSCKSSKPKADSDTSKKKDQTIEEKPKQKLLTYPVVPLDETLERYLCSVQPLIDSNQFELEHKITKQFQVTEGAQLQTLLERAAKSKSNWLTKRWTNATYLKVRSPVTVHTSPCMAFPLQKFLHPIDYFAYVAKCIYGMLEFKELVDNNEIPVIKMCQYELDNSQFGKIFGGVRRPQPNIDVIEQYNDSDYIVIINKNNFYKLPVYKPDGDIIHAHAMRDQLDNICNCPSKTGATIGLLTHDHRDNWAEAYEALICEEQNSYVVSVIEEALFTVSLDECVDLPPEGEERALQAELLLHGGGRKINSANRWMDKTLQLIVNPNGLSGICFEHSPADCQPLAMLMDFVHYKICQPGYGCETCNDEKIESFTPLTFEPLNKCVELWISVAERCIDKLCRHLQLHIFKFDCHGKNFTMAQGLNTDSYIQVALQLAFFMLYNELPAQYESAHLRIFKDGRTETIRSATNESLAFVKSMCSLKATKKDRMEGLRNAVDAHQELTKLALQGRGVDRHLFGLQQMAIEYSLPMPQFFKSAGYCKSTNYRVFSSQVATKNDAFLAYAPLTPCGYGCCYNPRENDIIFSISAWETNSVTCAKCYADAINKALNQIRKLVLDTGGDRVSIDLCKCDGGKRNKN